MGWFSKAVPKRKWPDVCIALGSELKKAGASWPATFMEGTAKDHLRLKTTGVSGVVRHYVSLLQLAGVAATLRDNSYISSLQDMKFFLEVIYVALTGHAASEFHNDLETMPFALVGGDARRGISLWADAMATEIADPRDVVRVREKVEPYGVFLVVRAQILTCEACSDPKGADRIRAAMRS